MVGVYHRRLVLLIATSHARAQDITSNLEVYWPCQDDAANTTVADTSGNSRNGTLTGGTPTTAGQQATGPTAALPKALNVTSTVYITRGSRITSGSPANLTVCCWMKTTQTANQAILSEHSTTSNQRCWLMGINGSSGADKMQVYLSSDGTSGGAQTTSLAGGTTINDGSWRHVAFVFDTSTVTFYVNGVSDGAGVGRSLHNTTTGHFELGD